MNPNDRITIDSDGKPCIRDLGIKVWEIYRDLVFHGMADEEVIRQHPELGQQDLLAVREHVAAGIRARTHDEITGRPILPKDQLRHGAYYLGRCRHATVARWNAEQNCFFHWRQKFGHIYIETIQYPTDEVEPFWDTFEVVEELLDPRVVIPFDGNATFTGNPVDLLEYTEEMWHRPK